MTLPPSITVTSPTEPPSASTVDASAETDDSNPSNGPDTLGKAIIVPILLIGALIFGLFILRGTKRFNKPPKSAGDENGPYLQHKAELEDEEKRKVELEAKEERYELNDDNAVHEAGDCMRTPTLELESEGVKPDMPSCSCRHELRGEEHCKELEAV